MRIAAAMQRTGAGAVGWAVVALLLAAAARSAAGASERDPGDPIRLAWVEGDVAGMANIMSVDGTETIGFVEYQQRRRGDRLELVRVARFIDGSSDEDHAEARVGATLEALGGRSIVRAASGEAVVDITIDVEGGRISGFYRDGDARIAVDDQRALPPGTYWGPLIFVVLRNFEQNAADGRLAFKTVVPTPKPRVLTLELLREGLATLDRPGGQLDVVRFSLRPTINWMLDPILHRIAPTTSFFLDPGEPPALARFSGPRNYAGQMMRLE